MRFLTAFLSKVVGEWTITGTERMKNRPIKILVDALNALGGTGGIYGEGGISSSPHFQKCVAGRRDFACRWGQFTVYFGVADDCPLMENRLTLHLEGVVISETLYQPDVTADGTIWGKGGMERADH